MSNNLALVDSLDQARAVPMSAWQAPNSSANVSAIEVGVVQAYLARLEPIGVVFGEPVAVAAGSTLSSNAITMEMAEEVYGESARLFYQIPVSRADGSSDYLSAALLYGRVIGLEPVSNAIAILLDVFAAHGQVDGSALLLRCAHIQRAVHVAIDAAKSRIRDRVKLESGRVVPAIR